MPELLRLMTTMSQIFFSDSDKSDEPQDKQPNQDQTDKDDTGIQNELEMMFFVALKSGILTDVQNFAGLVDVGYVLVELPYS